MPRKKKVTGEVSRRSAHSSLQTINKEKPQQRNAANARERARMRVLSRAFYRLKTALSWVPPDTKLSKLDTLRMAAQHISHMKRILESDDPFSQNDYYPPMTMTWPFAFGEGNPNGSGLGAGTESEDGEDECGMVDDGESLSCVSGSSWEEVRTAEIPMTSMTHQRVKDRSHLDQDNKSNPFNNTLHHHQHLTHHNFQQNLVSFS